VLCHAVSSGADLVGLLGVAAAGTAITLLLSAAAAAALTPKPQPSPSNPKGQSVPANPNDKTPPRSSPTAAATAAAGYRITSGPAAPLLLSLSFLAAAGPLALTRFDTLRFGAKMALPVGFAWSLLGYLAARVCLQQAGGNGGNGGGSWLQLSPVLAGAVAANVGVAWHSRIMGWQLWEGLSRYYTGEVRCME